MRNVWLVCKHEIASLLGKPSFWIMAFVFPAFVILLNVGTQVVTQTTLRNSGVSDTAAVLTAQAEGAGPIGYVDESGLVKQLPPSVPAGALAAFPDESQAQAALLAGKIGSYVVIRADYVQTGELVAVEKDFRPLGKTPDGLFREVMAYNLTGDETLTGALARPLPVVQGHALAPQTAGAENNPARQYVPFATLMIFFFLLTMSSSFMLQSVAREKENRTAEVLLLSIGPRELMLGKLLGLSGVALLQMFVWVGGAMLLLGQGQALLNMATGLQLPAGFFIWALLYFLLGYLMYASLMATLGVLAPDARSGSQFTILVLAPLMIPLFANPAFTDAPNGTVPTILSLIPLTAPTAMMTRLASVPVPAWQIGASLVGLAVMTYLCVLLSARFFRSDTLLSQSGLTWGRLGQELRVALQRPR